MKLPESPIVGRTKFQVLGENFTYPTVVQDLSDGITIEDFLKKYSYNETHYKNIPNIVNLGSPYIFKLLGSLDGEKNSIVNFFYIGGKGYNIDTLEKLSIYTKDKVGESFLVFLGELKSLTKNDRELSISLLHFYLNWKEKRKSIEEQINYTRSKISII